MENQIPSNVPPSIQSQISSISPEALEAMREQAWKMAEQQVAANRNAMPSTQGPVDPRLGQLPSKVVYVKRNLSVAEVVFMLLLSCGIVAGVQGVWGIVSNNIPRIEIKIK